MENLNLENMNSLERAEIVNKVNKNILHDEPNSEDSSLIACILIIGYYKYNSIIPSEECANYLDFEEEVQLLHTDYILFIGVQDGLLKFNQKNNSFSLTEMGRKYAKKVLKPYLDKKCEPATSIDTKKDRVWIGTCNFIDEFCPKCNSQLASMSPDWPGETELIWCSNKDCDYKKEI